MLRRMVSVLFLARALCNPWLFFNSEVAEMPGKCAARDLSHLVEATPSACSAVGSSAFSAVAASFP